MEVNGGADIIFKPDDYNQTVLDILLCSKQTHMSDDDIITILAHFAAIAKKCNYDNKDLKKTIEEWIPSPSRR